MKIVITTKDDKTLIRNIDALIVNVEKNKIGLVDEFEDVGRPYDLLFQDIKNITVIA